MKVRFEHVNKIFPNRNKNKEGIHAVDDFNFEIPDGKLIGLLGPSGCGKSTALYLICGLEELSSGKIYFGEKDVSDLEPENRGVSLVFQNYALYPHMSVEQNIMFPLGNLKGKNRLTKAQMKEKALEAAKVVKIEDYMDRKPKELSGGQQQRVAIARALVKSPDVLLMDEPLSNLDARLRIQTREEIRRIQLATKVTTIFVTHDQDEAMAISDYIVVMEKGHVRQIGKPQDVYDNPDNLFVAKFLGVPPINVFSGEVKNEMIYIGEDSILPCKGVIDQPVFVAIRPEGFLPSPEGNLHCELKAVEVSGRDVSIIAKNPKCITAENYEVDEEKNIRAVIPSSFAKGVSGDKVSFTIEPNKIFIFDRKSGDRIRFEVEEAK